MDKSFPADFYVTCATVIPVLFLALVVQGGPYEAILSTARSTAQRLPRRNRDYVIVTILSYWAYITLGSGCLGELFAVWALYTRSEWRAQRTLVALATLILLLAVVAPPAARLWQAFRAIGRQQLGPVFRAKSSPRFGYGALKRPLWTAQVMDAERIRGLLRDSGCPEADEQDDGFVVQASDGEGPFYVACTISDAMRAAAQMTTYKHVLTSAGFRVEPDPDDDQVLQVRIAPTAPGQARP